MALFKKRTRRQTRRAEAKALKYRAKKEAKLAARNERRKVTAETRAADRVAKAQVDAFKAQEKAALATAKKANQDRLSPAQVKKYLGVAKTLAPVLMPLAYQGATALRGVLDTRRARRLGVSVDKLADYTGYGAALSARIASLEASTSEILGRKSVDSELKSFANSTRDRLANLDTAVRAAELMPSPERTAAHTRIADELAGLERGLLDRLGVR